MKVNSVLQNYITPKNTGIAATTALGISVMSGISRNRPVKKLHKPSAYLAAIFTVLHIGILEYYHHKYKKM